MLKKLKRLIHRRKAVSPVVASMLLIALTVSSISIVYFLIVPYLNTTQFYASIIKVKDTNQDSKYDEITLYLTNTGTKEVEIHEVNVWTVPAGLLSQKAHWILHEDWNFSKPNDVIVSPSEFSEAEISSLNQIELSVAEDTFYRLEIYVSGRTDAYYSDWKSLNDQTDFSDLLNDFESFNLQAWGFTGTIDVPGWTSNNYNSTGGPLYGPFLPNSVAYLPVINESNYIPFYLTGQIVVFHSNQGNLTSQPTYQEIDRSTNPFKARKLFILGLAGSWGDEFPTNAVALTLNVTYTDGTSSIWELGHDYIDDWWEDSNANHSPTGSSECICESYGLITNIELGTQVDSPYEPIHTHTAGFYLDFYKYVQSISFTDPGTDSSAPHLLSITAG